MEIRQLRETEMEAALQLVWEVSVRLKRRSTPRRAWRIPVVSSKPGGDGPATVLWRLGGRPAYRRAGHERPHISLFFVRREWHRRGVGRALLHAMASAADYPEMTVHSSPYAVEVYRRFGFVPLGGEREENGIRYTPMVCRHWTF